MIYCNSLKENHSLCFRYLEQKLLYFITPHVRAPNEQTRETYVMLILLLYMFLFKNIIKVI